MSSVKAFRWTSGQQKAIAALEAAIAQAGRVGLSICGMDDSLLVYKARSLDEAEQAARMRGDGLHEAQFELTNVREEVHVLRTGRVYRDSGGW